MKHCRYISAKFTDMYFNHSLDPIIEPMLQSVPDPFDSYGPPQAEDQIFSILAPLSIMTNPQSPSTSSPLTITPERPSIEVLPTSSSTRIASWLPVTGSSAALPAESSEWAPSSIPQAPLSSSLTRRRSVSPSSPQRKAESKLRSILTFIDESQPHPENADPPPISPGFSLPSTNGKTEQIEHSSHYEWAFASTQPHNEDANGTNNTTPRHSDFFASPLPPALPPGSPPTPTINDVPDSIACQDDVP